MKYFLPQHRTLAVLFTSAIIHLFFSMNATAQNCALPAPSNLQMSAVQSCKATLTWNAVAGAAYYKVKYKVNGTSTWSPNVKVSVGTSYTFSGLNASTQYVFAVATYCISNKNSGFKNVKATTTSCSIPVVTTVTQLNLTSEQISWDGCSSGNNQIRYKENSATDWTYLSSGINQTITLGNLMSGSTYQFQLNACTDTLGTWSQIQTFTLSSIQRPNILLIILDDARYNSYSCNGGPEFFQSPNIDRIANEGANFKNMFAVESYCIPSRGTIVTGLYPHKHGAMDNNSNIYPYLPTTAKILDSAGYYTAWIGKYHMASQPQPGYDFWFATKVNTGTDEYNNMKYNRNGVMLTENGHDTDILTDTTLAFLDRNSDKPFFATLAYHAPHNPFIPQSQYNGMYGDQQMPLPDNPDRYSANYPSCVYALSPKHYIDTQDVPDNLEKYYELLAGVDAGIGKIFQKLSDLGILDNTCIILTSDNGFILGEHGFFMKLLAYDLSSRVPLFIRYPAWFSDSTVVSDQMALNTDITPTILDVAGIQGNYSFDGVSVRALADHSYSRTSMYYEYLRNDGVGDLPYIRSVRTMNSKIVTYGCNQSTQEFFDLTNDSEENTNKIFDTTYAATIESLSNQLSEFSDQLQDIRETKMSCSLKNVQERLDDLQIDEENIPDLNDNLALYPNPVNDVLNVAFSSESSCSDALIYISDMLGKILQSEMIDINRGPNLVQLNLDDQLSEGSYTVTVVSNDAKAAKQFLIQR